MLIILHRSIDATLTVAFFHTVYPLQGADLPVLGTSRYHARYNSRTRRLASSKSRLKIGLTTLAAPAAVRVAAVDAITATVAIFRFH